MEKQISRRCEEAYEEGLLTAGQVAQKLRKEFSFLVSARELRPFAKEWHHAGYFRGNMGRVWFFAPETDWALLINAVKTAREMTAHFATTSHPSSTGEVAALILMQAARLGIEDAARQAILTGRLVPPSHEHCVGLLFHAIYIFRKAVDADPADPTEAAKLLRAAADWTKRIVQYWVDRNSR